MPKWTAIVVWEAAGAIPLAMYLREFRNLLRLWRHGLYALGVVVDNRKTESDAGSEQWQPVLAFSDQYGRQVTARPAGNVYERMPIGRKLPVVYWADEPARMHIATRWYLMKPLLWHSPLLLIGVAFLGSGLAAALRVYL